MLRIILFIFLGLFILTGTNTGKEFLKEQKIIHLGEGLKDASLGNYITKQNDQSDGNENPINHRSQFKHTLEDVQLENNEAIEEMLTQLLDVFSISELINVYESVKNGLTEEEMNEIKEKLKTNLSAEDLDKLLQNGQKELKKYLNLIND